MRARARTAGVSKMYTLLINDFVKLAPCVSELHHVRMARASFTLDAYSKKLRMIATWQLLQTGDSRCRLEEFMMSIHMSHAKLDVITRIRGAFLGFNWRVPCAMMVLAACRWIRVGNMCWISNVCIGKEMPPFLNRRMGRFVCKCQSRKFQTAEVYFTHFQLKHEA